MRLNPGGTRGVMETIQRFDGRKIECPELITAARVFISRAPAGSLLHLMTCAPTSVANIRHYCLATGHTIEAHEDQGGEHHFIVRCAQASVNGGATNAR